MNQCSDVLHKKLSRLLISGLKIIVRAFDNQKNEVTSELYISDKLNRPANMPAILCHKIRSVLSGNCYTIGLQMTSSLAHSCAVLGEN